MTAKTLDFYLPDALNASHPPEKRGIRRDHVRMMVLNRMTGATEHAHFFELSHYLNPGDLIILNNSRTIPAVLKGFLGGEKIEIRLAKRKSVDTWDALFLSKIVNIGDTIQFSPELSAIVIDEKEHSPLKTIKLSKQGTALLNLIYELGEPIRYEYIQTPWDLDYYQTVFASHPGSLEMPSAGRAFTWDLLFKLQKKKIQFDFIQLHTGLSYWNDEHYTPEENEEEYFISLETMNKILETKASGHKVIATGTTVVRALESAIANGSLSGVTNLYIHPQFPLKLVDGIITGLHEPNASHLDMLSAFITEDKLLNAYNQAIQFGYLWHEFGDMNLII